jgi:hypothetical protein
VILCKVREMVHYLFTHLSMSITLYACQLGGGGLLAALVVMRIVQAEASQLRPS